VATAFRKLLQSRRDGVPPGRVERALQALEESALRNIESFDPHALFNTLHAMFNVQGAERGKHAVGVCDFCMRARGGLDEGAGWAGGGASGHV
jgi:hypothetical protein